MNYDYHETQNPNTITILIVEPMKEPYVKEIDSSLESLQHEVGGYIEAIYPFEEPVAIITNEEGKLLGLPLNRALRDNDGKVYDIIAGTFIISSLTTDDFGSLDEVHIKQFGEYFKKPEHFIKIGNQLVIVPQEIKQQTHEHIKNKEDNEQEL